jgi:hypothetical protein
MPGIKLDLIVITGALIECPQTPSTPLSAAI